jgi:hypothetical protein
MTPLDLIEQWGYDQEFYKVERCEENCPSDCPQMGPVAHIPFVSFEILPGGPYLKLFYYDNYGGVNDVIFVRGPIEFELEIGHPDFFYHLRRVIDINLDTMRRMAGKLYEL